MRRVIALALGGLCLLPGQGRAEDAVLARVRKLLDAGWTLRVERGELAIERTRPVWVLAQNLTSAPASKESELERAERIQRHGRQVRPRLVYRTEPRWTARRLDDCRVWNRMIHARIAALASRHRVDHLLDAAARRKNPDPALGASPEERARLATYKVERARLEARLVRLPDFHTASSSLFLLRREGWSDGQHLVHPFAAVEECYRLERKLRQALIAVE
jgi:hypothetical protein